MSLEQVKEIIRKPWAAANENSGAIEEASKPSRGKSTPNACVPARIPVRITIRQATGAAEIYIGMTILLNQRGARFESSATAETPSTQNPFRLNQMLWIEVLTTGNAAGGKVVWADNRRNADGNFEFAVELRDTGSLFNVFFLKKELDQPEAAKKSDTLTAPSAHRVTENLLSDATTATSLTSASLSPSNPSSASLPSLENSAADAPMTDRLAELFKEVIHSAVRKEEDAASVRLVKGVKDEVGQVQQAAMENLRKEVSQQVSVLEDQLLQRCRSRTEQVLSSITKTALQALSSEMEEMAERTEERIQGIFGSLVNQLEERSAKVVAEATRRLHAQAEESAKEMQGAIVQNALDEINEKQKDMLAKVQQTIGMTTDQNLVKLRTGLIRALQELTETKPSGKMAV